MKLRKLRIADAALMLEWMHDISVVKDLHTDFANKTEKDCEDFIQSAQDNQQNIHMAIVDDQDVYMGTVSLKNIFDETAEFAITIRTSAMGKGYSSYGMKEIIRIGFEELGLKSIYWCVSPKNKRAVRFYEKNGYHTIQPDRLKIKGDYTPQEIRQYLWYRVQP